MSRWFRLYDETLDDPKVQRLPAEAFKAWVNLLCLASRNDGAIPDVSVVAFALRMTEKQAGAVLATLVKAGLMEAREGGFRPHNWGARQYRSDTDPTAAERQSRKRARDRERAASRDITPESRVTSHPPEAETETDKGGVGSAGDAPAPSSSAEDLPVVRVRKALVAAFHKAGRLPPHMGDVDVWIGRGYDPELVIEICRAGIAKGATTLRYFTDQLEREHGRLAAERARPPPEIVPAQPVTVAARARHEPPSAIDIGRTISRTPPPGYR